MKFLKTAEQNDMPIEPLAKRIACADCGALYEIRPLGTKGIVKCARCDAVVYRHENSDFRKPLIFAVTGLLCFFIANIWPMQILSLIGDTNRATIIGSVITLARSGFFELAVIVFFMAFLIPLLKLSLVIYVLAPLQLNRRLHGMVWAMKLAQRLRIWGMVDVYMLAIIVALKKISALAHLHLGPGLYAFIGLFVMQIALAKTFDTRAVWERIGRPEGEPVPLPAEKTRLRNCPVCRRLSRVPTTVRNTEEGHACPRCGATVRFRKRKSVSRTWACIIAAALLYVPANLCPMMVIDHMGRTSNQTIISGVTALYEQGEWFLATIIFGASICIPMLKILALAVLLLSIQMGWSWRTRQRTILYRTVDLIGRWSMLDVLVTSFLVCLVRFGHVVTIRAGWGTVAFALVVILTMLGTISFDPRLLWDRARNPDRRESEPFHREKKDMEKETVETPPAPVVAETVEKKGTLFSALWALPLIVVIAGAWLIFDNYQHRGTQIEINFDSGEGIEGGKTLIRYNGIEIGHVTDTRLNKEGKVVVTAVIEKSDLDFARKGTKFWLVKPTLSMQGVSGLETILTGPYIAVHLGHGPKCESFTGMLGQPPPYVTDPGNPLRLVLHAPECSACNIGAPVYYRRRQVGLVSDFELADMSNHVNIHLVIRNKYAPLVRENTRFWNASGIDTKISLTGIKIHTEPLIAILEGGIAFATPNNDAMGKPVKDGAVFQLHDSVKEAWLKWDPEIKLCTTAACRGE